MRLTSIAIRLAVLGLMSASLSGCLAAAVAGTAVGVASAAVGTTAKVAAGTVHVGHMAVNAATGGGDNKDQKKAGE
ncbi:hypothetical protein [Phenylobacterium sp.]|uniref:hypothetical protein n=1 Tax=Phenylobacterium sp. TaxID=1871053 RepID=UPI002DE602A7|nr:hypothetical protein [Phenylobacterium sp.]